MQIPQIPKIDLSNFIANVDKINDTLRPFREAQNQLNESIRASLNSQNLWRDSLKKQIEVYEKFSKALAENLQKEFESARKNPEFHYMEIVQLELLSYYSTHNYLQTISSEKENLKLDLLEWQERAIEENLPELLKKNELFDLWKGAEFALLTPVEQNPDKIRHCMTSLRTMVEYTIEKLLSPDNKVRQWKEYDNLWEEYLKDRGITDENHKKEVKIPRKIRIKYFCSKVKFGMIEEFTQKDIKFLDSLYQQLCKVHSTSINVTDIQLRIVKAKAGIILWLLLLIYDVVKDER